MAILPFCPPVPAPRLRHVLLFPAFWLAIGAVGCSSLPRPQAFPPTQAAPPSKGLVAPAADPLAPSNSAANQGELRLTLAAGYYVRVAILSSPGDLEVRQLGPDGSRLEELQMPGGGVEPTRLSWLIEAPGEYRWTVVPHSSAWPSAAFSIWLEEERAAAPCDLPLLRAERAVLAARWVMSQPGESGPQAAHARRLLEPVVGDSIAAGDLSRLLAVRLEIASSARLAGAPDAVKQVDQALQSARAIGNRAAETQALQEQAQLRPPVQAVELLRVVLGMQQGLSDDRGEADVHYLLAFYHHARGETALALEDWRKSLAFRWRIEDLRSQPWTLDQLGLLYSDQGDSERAFGYFDVARELGRALHDIYAQAVALNGIARLSLDIGELQAAQDGYVQARNLLVTAGASQPAAWAMDGLGRVFLFMGEPERAREKYRQALMDFETMKEQAGCVDALLGIGASFEQEAKPQQALGPILKALETVSANGLVHIEGLARYDLGKVYRELGEPKQATRELEKAFALEANDRPMRRAQIVAELANAYLLAGEMGAAESAFRQAIQLSARMPVVEAAAQAGLARLERGRGDLSAARSAIGRALEITEKLRSSVIRPDQRVSFLAARRSYYELYVDVLMRLDGLDPGAGHAEEAVVASEQARARGLLDLLAKERVEVRHRIPPSLREHEIRIGERIARLQTRMLSETLPDAEARRVKTDLVQAEEEEREVDGEIRRRDPSYASMRTPSSLPLREIQGLLDERTALLEYFQGEESSFLFVVTSQSLAAYRLPPKRDLVSLIDRVSVAVSEDSRLRSRHFAEDAYGLYSVLMKPAAEQLRGKSHLIVAPDGLLYSVSFELLLTAPVVDAGSPERRLPYLIRERSVSYIPSASVLAQLLTSRQASADSRSEGKLFVGFGDPGEGSSSLPAARDEVRRIAPLFPAERTAIFVGADASEENVKGSVQVTWARNLHFATHGLLDEDHPDLSGLKLAHLEGSREDGLLQVREVFNLELHADLVVLSACQTGQGKEVSGEGLIGMTRAFLYAGAGSLVVSLWRVDDESTADLMVSFYRHLREIDDTSEALRLAKLELIDHSRYSHPYFWAPFVVVGRPR